MHRSSSSAARTRGAIRLTMGLLPHMKAHGGGHITNISSIGVQTAPPRFSAYIASKAALDAWTRVVSSEVIGDGITFTTIHMPLVRTPMIAPAQAEYRGVPSLSADEAAGLVFRAAAGNSGRVEPAFVTAVAVADTVAGPALEKAMSREGSAFAPKRER